MPMYSSKCESCETVSSIRLSFSDYDLVQQGTKPLSCSCGGKKTLQFDPSDVQFVMKDGESGGWASKASRENKYRKERYSTLGRKQKDHVKPHNLIPNYGGQVAGSWSEAQDAARQSTYERVSKEHGSREANRAATESAKTFNKYVKQEAT